MIELSVRGLGRFWGRPLKGPDLSVGVGTVPVFSQALTGALSLVVGSGGVWVGPWMGEGLHRLLSCAARLVVGRTGRGGIGR